MIGPEYGVQALAWAVVWAAGGLTVRQWLARKDAEHDERRHKAGQQR
jgi:hypothetical protein